MYSSRSLFFTRPTSRPVRSFFFFNDTATTEIYTLSLHDALPIANFRSPNRSLHGRRHVGRLRRLAIPGQPCPFPGAVRLGTERGRRRAAGGSGPRTCSPVSAPSATPASVGFAGGCGVQLRLPSPLPFLFGPPRSHRRLPPFYDREHCLCRCRHTGMGRQPDLGGPRSS